MLGSAGLAPKTQTSLLLCPCSTSFRLSRIVSPTPSRPGSERVAGLPEGHRAVGRRVPSSQSPRFLPEQPREAGPQVPRDPPRGEAGRLSCPWKAPGKAACASPELVAFCPSRPPHHQHGLPLRQYLFLEGPPSWTGWLQTFQPLGKATKICMFPLKGTNTRLFEITAPSPSLIKSCKACLELLGKVGSSLRALVPILNGA